MSERKSGMSRRQFLEAAGKGSLGVGLGLGSGLDGLVSALAPARGCRRPNIILIMADDSGFSDIGAYGGEIRTPHIDSLARDGVRFTQFYNAARCVPTRASLLTGLYNHKAGLGHMMNDVHPPAYLGHLRDQAVTMAEALGAAGYHTSMSGKWHLSHLHITGKDQLNYDSLEPFWDTKESWPNARGFEEFYGTIAGVNSFFDPYSLVHNGVLTKPESEDYYYTDAINDHAAGMIDRWAPGDQPFFLYVAHTAPHWPLHALPEDIAKYDGVYDMGWDAMRESRYRRLVEEGIIDPKWPLTPRDAEVPAWEDAPNKAWEARRMAVHAAMVDRMDQGIGRILAALERNGVADDTIVIYLSDNGASPETPLPRWYDIPSETRDGRPLPVGNDPAIMPGPEDTWSSFGTEWANASNAPFRLYKHWIHEGGIATPFIVRWPRVVQPGSISHEVGHIMDVMPTALEVAGVPYPEERNGQPTLPMDGKSLLPVLRGGSREGHEVLGWEHEGNEALRQGKWKLVRGRGRKWELYDMEADRTELNDLAAKHPERVREMEALHKEWMQRTGALPWAEYVRIRRERNQAQPK